MYRNATNREDVRDQFRAMVAAVAALPRRQRVALMQRRHHGLTYSQIAATLHCSPGAARAGVYAALRALAKTRWS